MIIVCELQDPDYAARINFFSWLLQNVHDRFVDPQLLLVTDDAWFYISNHVNMIYKYYKQWVIKIFVPISKLH
jgi:hypothetical protein